MGVAPLDCPAVGQDDAGVVCDLLTLGSTEEVAEMFEGLIGCFGGEIRMLQVHKMEFFFLKHKRKARLEQRFIMCKIGKTPANPLSKLLNQRISEGFAESVALISGIVVTFVNKIGMIVLFEIGQKLRFVDIEQWTHQCVSSPIFLGCHPCQLTQTCPFA